VLLEVVGIIERGRMKALTIAEAGALALTGECLFCVNCSNIF